MVEAKPFGVSRRAVWEAYRRVEENRGAAPVDYQSLEDFMDQHNDKPKPFVWTKSASTILEKVNRSKQTLSFHHAI